MIFVGVTRFSVFQPKSVEWHASKHADLDISRKEYLSYLYSDSRMLFRLHVFINLSLPLLEKGSKEFDYIHVVQYSSVMPKKFLDQLLDAEKRYNFLKLVEVNEEERYERVWAEVKAFMLPKFKGEQLVFGFFNLDDDDLLATSYFEQMKQYVLARNVGSYVSLAQGATGYYNYKKEKLEVAKICYSPKINIGLLAISYFNGDSFYIPRRGSHKFVDQDAPLILDSRNISYFWIRSEFQDTGISDKKVASAKGLKAKLEKYSRELPTNHLVANFPSLASMSDQYIYLLNKSKRKIKSIVRNFL